MKKHLSKIAIAGALVTASFGASIVSADNAAASTNIKGDMIKACVSAQTTRKTMNAADANKYCNCYVNIQSRMTLGDIWEIQSKINGKADPSTIPAVKRSNDELKQCAGNIKINAPAS